MIPNGKLHLKSANGDYKLAEALANVDMPDLVSADSDTQIAAINTLDQFAANIMNLTDETSSAVRAYAEVTYKINFSTIRSNE